MRVPGSAVKAISVLACMLAAPAAAQASVTFSSTGYPLPAPTPGHETLGAVAVVDLNADNRPDIVVNRAYDSTVFVMLNQGDGTFAAPQPYASCNGVDGGKLVTGQFSADGAADVIAGCEGTFVKFLGAGNGTLGAGTTFADPGMTDTVLALWPADDGGLANLLFPQFAQSVLCFRPVGSLGDANNCPSDTSHIDLNGNADGHAPVFPAIATAHLYDNPCPRDDVIFSPHGSSVRAWALNPFGDIDTPACSTFSEDDRDMPIAPTNLTQISTADLNGDGSPDLLMSNNDLDTGSLYALLWQTGGGSLGGGFPPGQHPVVTSTIRGIDDQKVADFDGDGHLDAAVAGTDDDRTVGTLAVSRGHGDGAFDTPPDLFAVPGGRDVGGLNHIAVGDLNGDGRPDVVSIASFDGSVTVLLNTTPAPPPPAGGGGGAGTGTGTGGGTGTGTGGGGGGAGGGFAPPATGLKTCKKAISVTPAGKLVLCNATNPPISQTLQKLVTANAVTATRARRRKVNVGGGKTTVASGRTAPVGAKLNSRGKALLRHGRSLRVTATIVATGLDGRKDTVTRTVTLRAPKRRR
jgi:hypothetical protein